MTDAPALRGARSARLRAAMADAGCEALLVTAASNIRYASGAVPLHAGSSVETARPIAAVVTARATHVLGVERESVPPDVERHPWPHGAAGPVLRELLGGARRVGFDRLPAALGAELGNVELVPADAVLASARSRKTAEEIELLRAAQALNEAAITDVLPDVVPGVREVDLAGRFLAAMARRGVTACHVEPVFAVIPRRAADAPWTYAGGLPYRELTSGRRVEAGDQVLIDTGMLHAGYMSDFGCTWVVGGPRSRDGALRGRWEAIVDAVLAVCRPGATAAALHRAALAANGAGRPAPWPAALYLAHGLGLGGVEPPFIGTDLGLHAEEEMVLAPGMVLVLEPYAWEEGAGGYRAEQSVVITDSGFAPLSGPPP